MSTKAGHVCAALLLIAQMPAQADTVIASGGEFSVDVSPTDGTIAMDLMDRIWTLAPGGGQAQQLINGIFPVNDPRWSPDGTRILYGLRTEAGEQVWELDIASGVKRRVIETPLHVQYASWHPDGERLVVVSTNVAETSVTLPNVRYVVDCGREKRRKYKATSGISAFAIEKISKVGHKITQLETVSYYRRALKGCMPPTPQSE